MYGLNLLISGWFNYVFNGGLLIAQGYFSVTGTVFRPVSTKGKNDKNANRGKLKWLLPLNIEKNIQHKYIMKNMPNCCRFFQ